MSNAFYDSSLTGEELDEALRKIPEIDSAVQNAQSAASDAAASANAASQSASNAAGSATTASNAASNAVGSANTASAKAEEAAASATQASQSAANAASSASTASAKAGDAAASASTASTKAEEAASSASTASAKAGDAAASASTASTKAEEAASSASTASAKAGDAAASATRAGQSADAAASSANTASAKAGEVAASAAQAGQSAANAASSANTASAKAGEAAASATQADQSADAAAAHANTANNKAAEAAASATQAGQSAANAASSANTASTKADEAATSATTASDKADAAAAHANTASNMAAEAAASASAAGASEQAAVQAATGCIDAAYNAIARRITRKADMDALFVEWWRKSWKEGSTTRLELLERWFGNVLDDDRVHGVKYPLYSTSPSPVGEPLYDSAGLSCIPSTATVAGQDDFAGLCQWWCLEVAGEKTSDGSIQINAVEFIDDIDTVRSGENGLCWVLQKNTYMRDYIEDGYRWLLQRCHPAEGYTTWEDGTTIDGVVHAFAGRPKYQGGYGSDGKPTCGTGLAPINYIGGDTTGVSKWQSKNSHYAGATGALLYFQSWCVAHKYASKGGKGNSGIIEGCSSYNYQFTAAVSESGVTRVILTESNAANLLEGSNVIVGNKGAGTSTDRNVASMYSLAKNVRIKSIASVTIDGTAYKAVELDTTSTFDTEAGATYISTMPYWSGWNDGVLGNDGSRISYTNGKEPALIQKMEMLTGAYLILGNERWQWGTDADGNYTFKCYVCRDQSKCTTGGSISSDYQLAFTSTFPAGTSSGWRGIEDIEPSEGGLTVWPRSTSTAAGSTTGHKAGFCCVPASSGVRAPWCCAPLRNGWRVGAVARFSGYGVGVSGWGGLLGAPGMAG